MADKVTFWVGTSGGEGKGAGFIGGRLFKNPQYFTTDDPAMIKILRNSSNVAKEIIEDTESDLMNMAPEQLKKLGYEDLQAICERLHIPVGGTKLSMIKDILGVINPESKKVI